MSALQAIVLGIVQGLTEFLPVSSTAHLRIVPAFLGWEDPGAAFTAVIQLGTMAAVVLYFRHDLLRIARAWLASLRDRSRRGELDARLGWYLIVATIPISVFGLAFKDQIENGARHLYLSGLFELKGVVDGSSHGAAGAGATAIATLLAFVTGYASIAFLLRFLTTHTTAVFVAYRVVLGAAVLALAGTHAIS